MKASLLARPAMVLFLAGALAGGTSISSFAATSADQNTNATSTETNGTPTANGTTAGTAATTPGTANAQPENLEQMANQRIEDLHSRLQITSHEQSEWNRFANVMRDNARQLDQAYEQRSQKFDTMNAVQNMESYAKIEKMRANDVEKLVPAFKSLYASLSSQQKQEADTLFRNRAQQAQQQHSSAATANR